MTAWKNLRPVLSNTAHAVALMIFGAWLLIQYLDVRETVTKASLEPIEQSLPVAFWLSLFIGEFLRPPEDRLGRSINVPSPRWSGMIVVLSTGFAAALFAGWNAPHDGDYRLPAAIVLGTIVIAAIVWRFATVHAAEIGEARFESGAANRSGHRDG